ncbi:MAG: hypothetical protein IJW18_02180 [Lachnospiraceae bacterium]|nr:hypothetical protein [Lachnospiraceae bacterium]
MKKGTIAFLISMLVICIVLACGGIYYLDNGYIISKEKLNNNPTNFAAGVTTIEAITTKPVVDLSGGVLEESSENVASEVAVVDTSAVTTNSTIENTTTRERTTRIVERVTTQSTTTATQASTMEEPTAEADTPEETTTEKQNVAETTTQKDTAEEPTADPDSTEETTSRKSIREAFLEMGFLEEPIGGGTGVMTSIDVNSITLPYELPFELPPPMG